MSFDHAFKEQKKIKNTTNENKEKGELTILTFVRCYILLRKQTQNLHTKLFT